MTLLDLGIDVLVIGGVFGNAARLALFLRLASGEDSDARPGPLPALTGRDASAGAKPLFARRPHETAPQG
jgi:hypothetical protein